MDKKKWLGDLADLLEQNPDARLTYYTSDDGVWLTYGNTSAEETNLGFTAESAIEALRAASNR